MRKLLFLLLLCGPTAAVWSQSRPVVPATLVVETKYLMALQDSVRLHRMARREAEHQRDSLLALAAEWSAMQPQNTSPAATEPAIVASKKVEGQPAGAVHTTNQQSDPSPQTTATNEPNATPNTTPLNSETTVPATNRYWVVVGGSPNAAEAGQMAKSYSRPPFQAVVVQAPSGINRVCWGPFSDEKTAMDVLRDARKIRPDAWYWHQKE